MTTAPILYDDVHHTLMQMGFTRMHADERYYDHKTGEKLTHPDVYSSYLRNFDKVHVTCTGSLGVVIKAPSCYPVSDCIHRTGETSATITARPTKPGMFRESLEAAIIAAARLGVIDADAGLIDTTVQPTVKGCGCVGCA